MTDDVRARLRALTCASARTSRIRRGGVTEWRGTNDKNVVLVVERASGFRPSGLGSVRGEERSAYSRHLHYSRFGLKAVKERTVELTDGTDDTQHGIGARPK